MDLGKNAQRERVFPKSNFSLACNVLTAVMTALSVVLNRFVSIHTEGWTIGFAFVPIVAVAIFCGPIPAAIAGGLADFIGAILFPFGPYFPGFTVVGALMGLIYGIFLHRGKLNWYRLLVPALFNNLVLGLLVNTLWVSILYGSRTYWGWFLYRLPEYAILVPMNLIFIPSLFALCKKLGKGRGLWL